MHWSDAQFALYLARRATELRRHLPDAGADPGAAVLAEAGLLEHLRALARRHGWLVYHTHDSRRSEPGFPDLVLVKPASAQAAGRLIFAEVKTAQGKLTVEQMQWLEVLRHSAAGVEVYCWRPQDLEAICATLQH